MSAAPDRSRRLRTAVVAATAVATLAAPGFLSESNLTVYVLLGTSAMACIGLALLMGYAGQVSLGQGAFFAIGGYTAGLLALHGAPRPLGLLLAPIVAAALAVVVGIPILRLRGHYLAFATLALQMILLSIVGKIDVLGGETGLRGIPGLGIGRFELASARSYAWLAWAGVAIVLVLTRSIIASRPGRALRALSTSETAAAACGVPVSQFKVTVFAISAGFAGLAGGIYAFFIGYLSPGSFPILLSIEFIVMAVVGGMRTLWGPVVGAATITILTQLLNALGTQPGMPAYASSVFSYAVYAGMLILVLLFLPRGVLPAVTDLVDALARRRGSGHDEAIGATASSAGRVK